MLTSELRREVKEVNEVQEVKDGGRIGPIKKYGDLLVYKQAYRLALAVSRFTKRLPREEQFELGRQSGDLQDPFRPTLWKDGRSEILPLNSRGISSSHQPRRPKRDSGLSFRSTNAC